MRQTPVLSDLELAILGLLREEPRSGYALRKVFAAGPIGDSPGSVYPALGRLGKAGLIAASADPSSGRGKETFHLTAGGRRALRDVLGQRLTVAEVRRNADAVIFRLPFVEAELGRASAAAFLADYASACTEIAAELKRERSAVADHGGAVYSARARWASKAAAELSARRG
jgi:DNA-binding PadR family transcriptional regulator